VEKGRNLRREPARRWRCCRCDGLFSSTSTRRLQPRRKGEEEDGRKPVSRPVSPERDHDAFSSFSRGEGLFSREEKKKGASSAKGEREKATTSSRPSRWLLRHYFAPSSPMTDRSEEKKTRKRKEKKKVSLSGEGEKRESPRPDEKLKIFDDDIVCCAIGRRPLRREKKKKNPPGWKEGWGRGKNSNHSSVPRHDGHLPRQGDEKKGGRKGGKKKQYADRESGSPRRPGCRSAIVCSYFFIILPMLPYLDEARMETKTCANVEGRNTKFVRMLTFARIITFSCHLHRRAAIP